MLEPTPNLKFVLFSPATVRTCQTTPHKDECIDEIAEDYTVHICYCNTDLCNNSPTMRTSATTLLMFVVGTIVGINILG